MPDFNMVVLVNLEHIFDRFFDPAESPEEILAHGDDTLKNLERLILRKIEQQVLDQSSGSGIRVNTNADARCEFGATPETRQNVLDEAEVWNECIRDNFRCCVEEIMRNDVLPLGSQEACQMAKAAQELSNNWFPFASRAVIDERVDCGALQVCLSPEQEQNIKQNPGNWALVNICVE